MLLGPSDYIAMGAFALSAFATWKTFEFNERQKSLIESQEKLNLLLLDKGKSEAINEKRADLGANFIKLGSSSYRLKIWNKGKTSARNVRLEVPDDNDILIDSEIAQKFPLEVLEQFQSVELIAAVNMGSKGKYAIKLIWSDDFSPANEKIVYPTI